MGVCEREKYSKTDTVCRHITCTTTQYGSSYIHKKGVQNYLKIVIPLVHVHNVI